MRFPDNFIWGASSAAAQIEGGYLDDGRTPSIWDSMPAEKVANMENCHIACDHYHRYKEDVELMKQIGLKAYRFSISWSRVIPERGKINEKGIAFYRDLIERLIDAGIMPVITLLHYDLPMWMFEDGGFENPQSMQDFADYAGLMIETYSDLADHWLVYNEPQMLLRTYKDLKKDCDEDLVYLNMLKAHGMAVKEMRRKAKRPLVISTSIMGLSTIVVEGHNDEQSAYEKTFSDDGAYMSMTRWTDPWYAAVIPDPVKHIISEQDMQIIYQPLDMFTANLYGATNYYRKKDGRNPLLLEGMPKVQTGKAIRPECVYWLVKFACRRYHLPFFYSENGYSGLDFIMRDGKCHDPQRIDFIHQYLEWIGRAIAEGYPVLGYCYWSIMDNFEWYAGYDIRYGLIYINYQTQERTLKDSAFDYRKIIESNGESI